MNLLRTEAISRFLNENTHQFLADLYNESMEVQVNVAQDGGDRIDGEYLGKTWHAWTDNITSWKSFRIPYHANTEPEYEDKAITFSLEEHTEGVGMTGWDWRNRLSYWVGYDFDAITDTKIKNRLTHEQLAEVETAAHDIPWVTVLKSTSGTGLHLYVFMNPVETKNHSEHAALARSVLGKMSAITGFDFSTKVDVCGGNMWVWHRKMIGTNGLTMLKQGEKLQAIPTNWRDHLNVITNRKRKSTDIETLASQYPISDIDTDHKQLMAYLDDNDCQWWWDQDNHMLITHTTHLRDAHNDLNLRGIYDTASTGKDKPGDHNCFMFPLRRGAWVVRRYTPGVSEGPSWEQDGSGWTRCYYNRDSDFSTICRSFGALEDVDGSFIFMEAEVAQRAALKMGINMTYDGRFANRKATMKLHKTGRIQIEINFEPGDTADNMGGWLIKDKKPWTKLFNGNVQKNTEPEIGNYDDVARHLVTESSEDSGWVISSDGAWRVEPIAHIKMALNSMGLKAGEINNILGSSVFKAWTLVNKPFQPEYPGGREWNREAAQLRFKPKADKDNVYHPTWDLVLKHCGNGLNDAVQESGWCKANGLIHGADYLKCWIASLFQSPSEPLPYLFFYGVENTGKSIFHEALNLLVTKGYQKADLALTSQSGFNGELEGAIICVVEEIDLAASKTALNRIKDWVTSPQLNIRHMYRQPYHITNTTHWIQCANKVSFCPIFKGDTRITMIEVKEIDSVDMIPKQYLLQRLEKEASDFTTSLLGLEIPESNDRLHVPILVTEEKMSIAEDNQSGVETFISEHLEPCAGNILLFTDVYDRFIEWIDPSEVIDWTKRHFGKESQQYILKGKQSKDNKTAFGNVRWKDTVVQPTTELRLSGGFLR